MIERDLSAYHALIRERCGLVLEGNREETLRRALLARVEALGINPVQYYARLLGSRTEFQELVNLLTINETYFFREPEQFRLVVDILAPRCLADRGGHGPVRILSAGCSSGEEPYSLVMALLERYGEAAASFFSVVAADIDSRVLEKAREGRYGEFSFRNMPPAVRQRYFDRGLSGNVLRERVKKRVAFHQVNFLTDVFPPGFGAFDIIFFRNVSIYFDTPTRRTIQRNLVSLLREDGVLLLGTSETLANDLGVLPLVQERGLFYFARRGRPLTPTAGEAPPVARTACRPPVATAWHAVVAASAPEAPPLPQVPPVPDATPAPQPDCAASLEAVRRLLEQGLRQAALVRLDAVLADHPDNAEARLLAGHILLASKDFAGAEGQADRVLAADAWSADAFLLRGLAAKWDGRPDEAVRWLKQAVYAQPGCWPAHYHLADLYRTDGDNAQAYRSYRVVLQLLTETPDAHGCMVLPLDLPAGEIRFLCRHQVARLALDAAVAGQK